MRCSAGTPSRDPAFQCFRGIIISTEMESRANAPTTTLTIWCDNMRFSLNCRDAAERMFAFVSSNKRTRDRKYRHLTEALRGNTRIFYLVFC